MNLRKYIFSPENNACFIAAAAAESLIERLEWFNCQPQQIAVIHDSKNTVATLQKQFTAANVFSIVLNESLLHKKNKNKTHEHAKTICSDLHLSIRSHCIDLLVANCLLPWCASITDVLKELHRCLADHGVILLSTFGPDTLQECRALFAKETLPQLIDMHDLGDLLLQSGFADPVLEVDYITATYTSLNQLANELCQSGMIDCSYDDAMSLLSTLPKDNENKWSITYEIIYAHAFCPEENIKSSADGSFSIPLSQLRKQLLK